MPTALINDTCREDDKKAQCSNECPEVAFKAVTLTATTNEPTVAIPCNTASEK